MHITGCGSQVQRKGVVIGGDPPAIAADERQCRTAVTLAGHVLEIAHDQPEGVQIPVQAAEEVRCLHHQVPEALYLRGFTGRTLGGVDPALIAAEI